MFALVSVLWEEQQQLGILLVFVKLPKELRQIELLSELWVFLLLVIEWLYCPLLSNFAVTLSKEPR
jgi:hypothetical protein